MDNKSIINIINSILLASSSSHCCGSRSSSDTCGDGCDMNHGHDDSGGTAAVMLNEGNVTITPITGGLTNALYKVDYTMQHHHLSPKNDKTDKTNSNNKTATTQSSLLVRIFGADGIINRDIETHTFAQLCNTTGTTTTTTTTTTNNNNKLVHPKLDILGRFANGRLETYIPNMRPATVQDLVGDVEKSTTNAHAAMKKTKKKNDEEEDGQHSPQLLLGLEVVRQMARLHHGGVTTTATTSSSGFASYQQEQEQQHQPTLWKVINSWIYDLDIHIGNAKISNQQYYCQVLHNVVTDKEEEENNDGCNMISYYRNDLISYLYNEVTWLQQYVETRFCTTTTTPPSVVPFCHNDINPGNILLRNDDDDDDDDDDTTTSSSTTTTTTTTNSSSPPIVMEYNQQTVCIIDYEYCDTNYAMYDMANYICEYAGGNDNGIPNYNLLPSMEVQMTLLHEYIRTRNELTTTTHDGDMSCDDDNDDDEVEQLLEQVQVFQMASCLLWGVWGILQYTTQIIDNDDATTFTSFDENVQSRLNGEIDVDIFDYLRYGKKRLARYRYLKQKIMMD
jgi:thiamine kinase-like enzyme